MLKAACLKHLFFCRIDFLEFLFCSLANILAKGGNTVGMVFKSELAVGLAHLVIGGIGFAMIPFIHDQYLQFVPFMMIGAGWAAMLAMPFSFVTNALQGYGHMGAYLGLFNGTICIPQIVAALCGGHLLHVVGSHQSNMMIVAGALLVCGAAAVTVIHKKEA